MLGRLVVEYVLAKNLLLEAGEFAFDQAKRLPNEIHAIIIPGQLLAEIGLARGQFMSLRTIPGNPVLLPQPRPVRFMKIVFSHA